MADRELARELVAYAKTDKLLAWQRLVPWINNFAQKKAKGVFSIPKAQKALADYLFTDTYGRYSGRGAFVTRGLPHTEASTKLLFGKLMLTALMPRIKRTAEKMKKVGLVKGKLIVEHPGLTYRR